MPYDLYGQYYASRRDAENAELAQMAQIDADLAYREQQRLKEDVERQSYEQAQYLGYLESKIENLEQKARMLERGLFLRKPKRFL